MKEYVQTNSADDATSDLTCILQNSYQIAQNMGFDYLKWLVPNLFIFQSSLGINLETVSYMENLSSTDGSPDTSEPRPSGSGNPLANARGLVSSERTIMTAEEVLLQQKYNRAIKEMDEKLALLTKARAGLTAAFQRIKSLGIRGTVQSDNIESAIKSKIEEMQTIISDSERDKKNLEELLKGHLKHQDKLKLQEENLVTDKDLAGKNYNKKVQTIYDTHDLKKKALNEALENAEVFKNSLLGRFLDFFTPKTLVGLLGFTIKTNLDIYNEKKEAYVKFSTSSPDTSDITKPDFTARENALAESKKSAQEWIDQQNKKIDVLNEAIENAQVQITSLTDVLHEIQSLQENVYRAQEDVNASMQFVRQIQAEIQAYTNAEESGELVKKEYEPIAESDLDETDNELESIDSDTLKTNPIVEELKIQIEKLKEQQGNPNPDGYAPSST